jgi:hypothetical protein
MKMQVSTWRQGICTVRAAVTAASKSTVRSTIAVGAVALLVSSSGQAYEGEREGGMPSLPAQPALDISLTTDRPVYFVGEPVAFTLSVTNQSSTPTQLTFTSGAVSDFAVMAADGSEVWRWSTGRDFTQTFVTRSFPPCQPVTFVEQWDQRDNAAQAVPAGVYTVIGQLTTNPPLSTSPTMFVISEV